MSSIIKEFSPKEQTCVLRRDAHGSSLQHFQELFQEALKDFPQLTLGRALVKCYWKKRLFGLEFVVKAGEEVPETYRRILWTESAY